MRQIDEKEKIEIAREYCRREKNISSLKKNIKRICAKSSLILIPATIITCIFVGPLGLLCLAGFLFPIVGVDYQKRLMDEELNMCLRSDINLRQLKRMMKSGQFDRYVSQVKEEERNRQVFSQVYNFEKEKIDYSPAVTKFETTNSIYNEMRK